MTQLMTSTADLATTDLSSSYERFDALTLRFIDTRRSANTRNVYQRIFKRFRELATAQGVDPLKADALIAFNSAMHIKRRDNGGDMANDSVALYLRTLQSFFGWLHALSLSDIPPGLVSDIISPPPTKKLSPRDILTEAEAEQLLEAISDSNAVCRDRCLIRLMLDGGLRVSEAIGIRAQDVYAAGGRHYAHVASGKGDKSRDVEIPADLYTDLRDCMLENGIDLNNARDAQTPLFTINRNNTWRMVGRTAKRAGIPKRITPHSLRHTHAHTLRMLEWPIELISARLGHSSIETTKIYTRPAEMAKRVPLPPMPWSDKG